MDTIAATALPAIGEPLAGGFYAGKITICGILFALIAAPKADGEHAPIPWIPKHKDVPGATSDNDGLTNTQAMAESGSKLAKWALNLDIAGHADWYLPSQDELEILYRNLKPGSQANYCWARSGINLSAIPPTRQTPAPAFQTGGSEAFDEAWHWSSTQHAAFSDYAWLQGFDDDRQDCIPKSYKARARAVRRLIIE